MIIAFCDHQLDNGTYELRRGDEAVAIEPQVFEVLWYLASHADRVVAKEELLDQVWGTRFVTESALTSRIKAARRAVGDDGQAQRVIRTVHGRGYRFVAPVDTPGGAEPAAAPLHQEIRFCTTDDGVRLAYATMGEGPPLLKAANWLSHLDYDHQSFVWRHWLAEFSRRFRLVRYDERGCGLSDWDVPDFSFEAWVRDLETVVEAAGLERFPLLGISQGGPVAIAYAVRHPERVSHLVLLGSYAQGRRKRARTPEELELAEARTDMVRLGWARSDSTYRQVLLAGFFPEGTQEEWREFDELQRRSTSAENAYRFVQEFGDIDVTDLCPKVSAPTLILGSRREPDGVFEQSRVLASLIPDSRLVPLDSSSHLLPERDPAWKQFLAEIDAFLLAQGP